MPVVLRTAVINQKGGVGKTTTVANLGAGLAARGHDTCLIDLDPQANLTLHFGIEPGEPAASMYDVLGGQAQIGAATMILRPHLWFVPSVIDLAAAEVELVSAVGREQILRDALAAEQPPYEFVMIDCPPSLGLLTLNALAAADEVFIPMQPHFLALQGLGKLLETVSLVQRRINPSLRVSGVVLCMYESTTRLAAEVVADLEAFFAGARSTPTPWSDARIFRTFVRRNVKLAECPSHGSTIFDYAPSSHGAADYSALADEFLGQVVPGAAGGPNQQSEDPVVQAGPTAAAPTTDEDQEPLVTGLPDAARTPAVQRGAAASQVLDNAAMERTHTAPDQVNDMTFRHAHTVLDHVEFPLSDRRNGGWIER